MKVLTQSSRVVLSLVAVAVAAAQLFIPDPAQAEFALFRLKRSWHGNDPADDYISPFYNPKLPNWSTAEVGTTTPVRSVIFPRKVIGFGGPDFSPFTWSCSINLPAASTCDDSVYTVSKIYYSYYNYKGFFVPSNPFAPTTHTVVPAKTLTTHFGGAYDFSRYGSIQVWPGAQRFGGTMRYFWGPNHGGYGRNVAAPSPSGRSTWTGAFLRYPNTPNGDNVRTEYEDQYLGATYPGWQGYVRHLTQTTINGGPVTAKTKGFYSTIPWTTGKVRVSNPVGDYPDVRTLSGYDNRTSDGFEGKLSLVVPWLTRGYYADAASIRVAWQGATINKVTAEFGGQTAPEPAGVLLLGAGIVTLAGLYRLRRR